LNLSADQINDLQAMIDGIPFGAASWDEVVNALGSTLPGSFTAIQNGNFAAAQLNSFHSCNIEPYYMQAYADYYFERNPWEAYWSRVPAGTVAVSEEVAPSSLFEKTEFYNEWLMPQNNVAAAAGLKIAADHGETIRMLFHYPLDRAAEYDRTATILMRRLKGSLNRTIQLLRSVRDMTELETCRAAFVARGNRAAFIVGVNCVIEDANDAAEALFRTDVVARVSGRQVKLKNLVVQTQFAEAVSRLCRGQATEQSSFALHTEHGRWLVTIAAIGTGASYGLSGLLPFRRKVFVTLTPLSGEHETSLNHATTFRLFGLTRGEHDLCEHLLRGVTLAEAADALHIAKETARSRLKSIFAKTGVTRQVELALLLSKLDG
jgi:DNA-binding CsgD family transcriptional regulator